MATQNILGAPFPFATTFGGTGIDAPTAHAILVGADTDPLTEITLTDGQVLIGSTGADPVAATLTAGSGITITPGAGTITIANSSLAEAWVPVSGTTQALAINSGYICNNVGVTTLTLPATAAVGSVIEITSTASTYVIAQNSGQTISFLGTSTTAGVTGTYTSDVVGAAVRLLCVAANTGFQVLSAGGNPTLA